MAISQDKWDKAREYFEAGLSLSEIVLRTEISKAQISKKSKAENWQKGNEKKHLISQAVEVNIKKETLKETALEVHNEIVNERTKHLLLFQNSALKNQKKANELLELTDDMKDLESHARITKTNKETVLGKEPDTVINNANLQQNEIKTINIVVE